MIAKVTGRCSLFGVAAKHKVAAAQALGVCVDLNVYRLQCPPAARLLTKHEVPIFDKGEKIGDSGSIVFRSICDIVSYEEVQKKIKASRKQKAAVKVKKEADKKRKRQAEIEMKT